jgi:hydrogenase maturation protease
MHVSIVGIGNLWASDDGVGPKVVHRLRAEWLGADHGEGCGGTVEFHILPAAGTQLLDIVARSDLLIVVDAVSSGLPPGTIHRTEWQPGVLAPRNIERTSSHGFGLDKTLALAAALEQAPKHVILWGVEIACTHPGERLSPSVAAALPTFIARLRQELDEHLHGSRTHCQTKSM